MALLFDLPPSCYTNPQLPAMYSSFETIHFAISGPLVESSSHPTWIGALVSWLVFRMLSSRTNGALEVLPWHRVQGLCNQASRVPTCASILPNVEVHFLAFDESVSYILSPPLDYPHSTHSLQIISVCVLIVPFSKCLLCVWCIVYLLYTFSITFNYFCHLGLVFNGGVCSQGLALTHLLSDNGGHSLSTLCKYPLTSFMSQSFHLREEPACVPLNLKQHMPALQSS